MTTTVTAPSLPHPVTPSPRHPVTFHAHAALLALLICGAIAPTLTWLEFSNGSEGLNVGTVQEMYQTGQWLVPSLQGTTRLAKPPLTAWLTASAVSSQTIAQIASPDQAIRDHGFVRLAWETRWPTLLAGFITLLLTAELGRLIAGPSIGIAALVITGTSLLFLRFIRFSSTDVQLMLWVAAANVFIAHALLRGRVWTGCIGAGITLGLGMLAKGPLVLLQSVVPFALWLAWDRRNKGEARWPGMAPVLTAAGVFLTVGMSWFVMVYIDQPRAVSIWIKEMTREGATEAPRDPWYRYLSIFLFIMPWMIFLMLGIYESITNWKRTSILPLLLTFVPLIVMSIAKDKADRYILPMLPAAAILAGMGLSAFIRHPPAVTGHWIIVAFFAIGFPIAAMLLPQPWATPPVGGLAALAGTLILCIGLAAQRWTTQALLYTTLLVMLGAQVLFISGYRSAREGRAELKPLADMIWTHPSAKVWHSDPRPTRRAPTDVVVYLNRIITNIKDPLQISQADVPQVLLLEQNRGEPPEPSMPPPWRFLGKYPRDNDLWWAFLLPPE